LKALKIIGILIGSLVTLIVVAAGIFYVGWCKAPSPDEVCAHIQTLMAADLAKATGSTGMKVDINKVFPLDKCIERSKKGDMQGLLPYVAEMKCALKAESTDALKECHEKSK
jgi:hypothetical protein